MNGKQIANETINQMGGFSKLAAMVGAHNFVYDNDGMVKFSFKMCGKTNMIKIELSSDDLYDVSFYKFSRKNATCDLVAEHNGIYNDQLRSIFERETGLYLSL